MISTVALCQMIQMEMMLLWRRGQAIWIQSLALPCVILTLIIAYLPSLP